MGDSSFALDKLRRLLAPVMDELVLNEGFDDATVGFVKQVPDLRHRKFLVRKQIANRELSLVLGRQLRCIFRHDEWPLRQLERFS